MEKIDVQELSPVARTLLIPLACRAREALRSDGLIRDKRAVELFSGFESGLDCVRRMSGHDQAFIAMRARQFDHYALDFLAAHDDGIVVDIGCGLDTRFDRLDNGKMTWLGLDLPEVIELRRRFLPDSERCRSLACSMFEPSWMDTVAREHKPAIFLAEGVFPYFREEKVKSVIMALSKRFPGAGLVLDSISPFSTWLHNRTSVILKETGTSLGWALGDPRKIESWGLRLQDKWGYFDNHEPRLGAVSLMRYMPPLANGQQVLYYLLDPAIQ